jgi:hypothetical protein
MKHRPVNPLVGGSNPSRGATSFKHLALYELSNIPASPCDFSADAAVCPQLILDALYRPCNQPGAGRDA